jgi:hypothetical protein
VTNVRRYPQLQVDSSPRAQSVVIKLPLLWWKIAEPVSSAAYYLIQFKKHKNCTSTIRNGLRRRQRLFHIEHSAGHNGTKGFANGRIVSRKKFDRSLW